MEEGRISGGGGCCIARYVHNHGLTQTYYNPFDLSKIDHAMLRFRPIAPKPVVDGPTTPNATNKNDTVRKCKRKNRGKNSEGNRTKRGRKSSSRSVEGVHKKVDDSSSNGYNKVTLSLLPKTPDLNPTGKDSDNHVGQSMSALKWLCFGPSDENDQTAVDVVESSVNIEGVTDTWMDGNGLGCTDEERRIKLDEDTCPGFISDSWNRVWWTNKAYRRMVAGDEDTWGKESVVMVKLGIREKVDLSGVKLFPAFTCMLKVQYGKKSRMTVPCDACRMDGGGFAWRLDIKAALSLGR